MEKIGVPVFNMDEMCTLEMILLCMWCSALVQVLHALRDNVSFVLALLRVTQQEHTPRQRGKEG